MSKLRVSVWRGAEAGEYRGYEVPRQESQSVLDVVTFIQRYLDPTLAYRFACRVGMCGSCGMTVNGAARIFREDYPEPGNMEQSAFTRIRLQGDAYSTQFVPVEFSRVAPGESLIEPEPA